MRVVIVAGAIFCLMLAAGLFGFRQAEREHTVVMLQSPTPPPQVIYQSRPRTRAAELQRAFLGPRGSADDRHRCFVGRVIYWPVHATLGDDLLRFVILDELHHRDVDAVINVFGHVSNFLLGEEHTGHGPRIGSTYPEYPGTEYRIGSTVFVVAEQYDRPRPRWSLALHAVTPLGLRNGQTIAASEIPQLQEAMQAWEQLIGQPRKQVDRAQIRAWLASSNSNDFTWCLAASWITCFGDDADRLKLSQPENWTDHYAPRRQSWLWYLWENEFPGRLPYGIDDMPSSIAGQLQLHADAQVEAEDARHPPAELDLELLRRHRRLHFNDSNPGAPSTQVEFDADLPTNWQHTLGPLKD